MAFMNSKNNHWSIRGIFFRTTIGQIFTTEVQLIQSAFLGTISWEPHMYSQVEIGWLTSELCPFPLSVQDSSSHCWQLTRPEGREWSSIMSPILQPPPASSPAAVVAPAGNVCIFSHALIPTVPSFVHGRHMTCENCDDTGLEEVGRRG